MDNNVGADHQMFVRATSLANLPHMTTDHAQRPTERPYHHGNLRSALLAAAERTMRARGVQGLSLRELAREVGVSHGAPRRHFPDRQALLDALAESGFERLGAELRAAADGAGGEFQRTAAGSDRRGLHPVRDHQSRVAGSDVRLKASRDRAEPARCDGACVLGNDGAHPPGSGDRPAAAWPDPERVGLVLFSTIQGIAALLTAIEYAPGQLDELTADAIAKLFRGSRTAG